MIRTQKRLHLCICLLALNLLFIWGNSLLPGGISRALSDLLKSFLTLVLPGGEEEAGGSGLLRKLAHFTEFASLGVLLFWLVGMLRNRRWELFMWPLTAGIAVAAVDETIQCFVPLRQPALKDVGIDTLGVITGIVILSLMYQIKKKKYLEETK